MLYICLLREIKASFQQLPFSVIYNVNHVACKCLHQAAGDMVMRQEETCVLVCLEILSDVYMKYQQPKHCVLQWHVDQLNYWICIALPAPDSRSRPLFHSSTRPAAGCQHCFLWMLWQHPISLSRWVTFLTRLVRNCMIAYDKKIITAK